MLRHQRTHYAEGEDDSSFAPFIPSASSSPTKKNNVKRGRKKQNTDSEFSFKSPIKTSATQGIYIMIFSIYDHLY